MVIIQKNIYQFITMGLTFYIILLTGCSPKEQKSPILPETLLPGKTFTPSPTQSLTTQVSLTRTPTPTEKPLETGTVVWHEPDGCLKPVDGYSLVTVNGWLLNERTLGMLKHTRELYSGPIDITGIAITQGSYHDNGEASFGTHLGGGAVDLSVISIYRYEILTEGIEPLIHALRLAGFAAWYRKPGDVYPGSPPHIHAIAIGDQQLSDEARLQLTGPAGYFRGYDGLPSGEKPPAPDPHGGPVLCRWMLEAGYSIMAPAIP